MELKQTDVFIIHSKTDSTKVEPWAVAVAAGGTGVRYDWGDPVDENRQQADADAQERCKLVLLFLSAAAMAEDAVFQDVVQVRQMKKPVLVLLLESVPMPQEWLSLLSNAPSLDLRQEGRRACWDAVLQVLRERRVKWADPDEERPLSQQNARRSSLFNQRLATVVVLALTALLLVYFGFIRKRVHPSSQPAAAVKMVESPKTESPKAPEAKPVPPPIVPAKAEPVPTPPAAVPVQPPVDFERPLDAMSLKALEHVKAVINFANRKSPLDEAHISKIVSFFADPAWIQDRGKQDRNGLTAYMQVRQLEWPKWLELVKSMDVKRRDGDAVVVAVRSSFFAENPERKINAVGVLNTRYTLVFAADGSPSIVQVEGEAEKPD